MRIALVFKLKDSLGGAERRLSRIFAEICRYNQEMECDLVLRNCNQETAEKFMAHADCDTSAFHNIYCFEKPIDSIFHILRSRQYDIVQFFSASRYNIFCQMVCKISGKKNLYTVCGYGEAYNTFGKKHMRRVRTQLKLADAVDVLYPSGEAFIKSVAKDKPVLITPGTFTDLSVFTPKKKNKTMLFVAARLEETKNPMLLIEACALCKDQLRQFGYRIVILGKGVLEEKMKSRILEENMSDIVEMVGYAQTSLYIPEAEVFFSLQRQENYPSQSLAEAAACGCYCIITDVGDSRYCADDSFAAFVEAQPAILAEEICHYLELPNKENIANNARMFAEKNYTIDASKEYFINLFREMMEL